MRKQSDATKLRRVKRELRESKIQISNLERKIRLLKIAGSGMSNVLFNFSQLTERFNDDERESFRRSYKDWDSVG